MLRTALCLGLATLVAGSPAASSSFAGVPDVEVRYYDVSGRTPDEIRASLDRHRRTDPNTGLKVDAWTAWRLRWDVPGSLEGKCQPDKAVVTLDVTVGLPRLANSETVPPAVLQRWQRYIAAVTAHEANHVRIANAGRKAVLHAIHESDCAAGPQAAEDAMAAMDRRNDEYDRVTRNGWTEGAHFP
jgi:predicted secreted Zn-dependent protease